LIIHEKVYDKFLSMVVDHTKKLRLGDGLKPNVDVGPCVNEGQRKTVDEYVQIAKGEGAQVLTGGKNASGDGLSKGWFYEPTVLGGVTPQMRVAREEIFGPVLSVIKIKSLEEAIAVSNNTMYGLSSSIYTQDINNAYIAIRDIKAGITYVNSPTIGAEAHMPFGGVKETGNGHREGGWTVYDFYTEWKAVYVDYSGKLQRAQIDNVE
jgi:alpha-ketoglutaric semialdehyde dehydrogenase